MQRGDSFCVQFGSLDQSVFLRSQLQSEVFGRLLQVVSGHFTTGYVMQDSQDPGVSELTSGHSETFVVQLFFGHHHPGFSARDSGAAPTPTELHFERFVSLIFRSPQEHHHTIFLKLGLLHLDL